MTLKNIGKFERSKQCVDWYLQHRGTEGSPNTAHRR